MKSVKILFIILVIFLILVCMSFSISALNAKIGNAKMILRGKVGETINKSVKVINDNDITVKIELMTSGELSDSIILLDNNFTLEAQEEKDAKFQIKVNKEGEQNGSVVVKFLPANIEDGKNGVALSSTIILIGEKGDGTGGTGGTGGTEGTGGAGGTIIDNFKITPLTIGLIITAVVFMILIITLIFYSKKSEENIQKVNEKVKEIKLSKRVKKE